MAKVIERRYDVKIRIMDSSLVEEYFTCHFRKDLTIAQAMELLKRNQTGWIIELKKKNGIPI